MSENVLSRWQAVKDRLEAAKQAIDEFQDLVNQVREEAAKQSEALKLPMVPGVDQERLLEVANKRRCTNKLHIPTSYLASQKREADRFQLRMVFGERLSAEGGSENCLRESPWLTTSGTILPILALIHHFSFQSGFSTKMGSA